MMMLTTKWSLHGEHSGKPTRLEETSPGKLEESCRSQSPLYLFTVQVLAN